MKIRILLVITAVLIISNTANAQDLSFEDYNPKSTLVVPGNSVKKAKFPFIDVHGHQYRMATQDLKPVITAMDTLNLQVMVNLSGRTGEDLIKAQENANTNYPGRFVLFCNIVVCVFFNQNQFLFKCYSF